MLQTAESHVNPTVREALKRLLWSATVSLVVLGSVGGLLFVFWPRPFPNPGPIAAWLQSLDLPHLAALSLLGFAVITAGLYFGMVGPSSDEPIATIQRLSIQRLSEADTKDVQRIAASQIELLIGYYRTVLAQSDRSFRWALIGSGIALAFFLAAVGFSVPRECIPAESDGNGLSLTSIVPLLAGAIVQVVSGLIFVLYGKTSSQLSAFHSRLEGLQRYLLANSICGSLGETERDKARAVLIAEISRAPSATT